MRIHSGCAASFIASILMAGCRAAAPTPEGTTQNLFQSGPTLNGQFFAGLMAAPNSAERHEAGAILEKIINEKVYKVAPEAPEDYNKQEQDRTRHVLNNTIEYLKTGNRCAPEERIRVYRGFGNQALLKAPGTADRRLMLSLDWTAKIVAEFQRQMPGGRDPGEVLFAQMAKARQSSVENYNWALAFGMGRDVARSREPDPINMKWGALASTHSIGSDGSPLLSVALRADVSDKFGPAFLVADICPERALLLQSTFAFGETEIYVPLFILPEEIVRIEGLDCGIAVASGKSKREGCYQGQLKNDSPLNPATQALQNCYINFGQASEYMPWADRQAVKSRWVNISESTNSFLDEQGIAAMRTNYRKLANMCQPSCKTAAQVVADHREDFGRPSVSEDPITKQFEEMKKVAFNDYLNFLKKACPDVK